MKPFIIQALPGTGKTTLAAKLEADGYSVIDSDIVWYNLSGTEKTFEEVVEFLSNQEVDVIVTNLWLGKENLDVSLTVFPEWNTWLETIIQTRYDLVEMFGFDVLKSWFDDYVIHSITGENVVQLGANQYLSDMYDYIVEAIKIQP